MRHLLIFIFISALLLAGCGSAPATLTPDLRTATLPKPTITVTPLNLGNCIDARQPTPVAKAPLLFAPVSEKDHILGPGNAPATILVYSDFQCATCATLAAVLKSIQEKHPNEIRVVFRPFPMMSKYNKTALATQAAEAAALQGKFPEMHDLLFSNQAQWQKQKPDEFKKWLLDHTDSLGLNKAQFEKDLTSPEMVAIAQNDWDEGQKIGLPGAPVILVNGEIVKWQVNLFDGLESVILMAMLKEKQFSNCPSTVIKLNKKYDARLKTSKGEVVIRLFVDKAPNTVNNFVFLAQDGWYDNNPFLRVVPGFVARTGDPTGTGLGGPGYFIPNETDNMLGFNQAGMVGMFNSGKDTNGSQFFITLGPAPKLNNAYTVFGQVLSGMDVLTKLTSRDPTQSGVKLPEPDMLISVTIEEK
jgi:cyclophilin family peptidyl-prolyl cis-trans isomerase/protein-disulfide isomerase